MAVLSRNNWVAQQRLDLQHLLAMESYIAFDFRSLMGSLAGESAYVLKGLEVIGKTGLAVTFNCQESLTFNPLDGNGSFYMGLSTDDNIILELPANSENLFVEATYTNESINPVNTAQWDALALTGDNVAGTEFSASLDSQIVTLLSISVNTVGFTEGSIPIMRATTDGSNVTNMIDCRPMYFRLGSGGVSPNPANKFLWGTERKESPMNGTGVGLEDELSPFQSKDETGIINDKGISSQKAWMDAVMTRFCELAGSSLWYAADTTPNNPIHGYITGVDLQRLALDTEIGHSIQPSENITLKWVRQDPSIAFNESTNYLVLTAEGIAGTDDTSAVSWQVNYGPMKWELGGNFVPGTRQYVDRDPGVASRVFESPYIVDGGNLYLLLERDVVPPDSTGNAVDFYNNDSYPSAAVARTISGATGDFTGIAVGDWVKKSSEGFSQYYKVVQLCTSSTIYSSTVGVKANSSVVAIVVDRDIATGSSTEVLHYFRSRYSASEDLVSDITSGEYLYKDLNYYWIGRRVGSTFILRGFGNLKEGEEAFVQDDSSKEGPVQGGQLLFKHWKDAVFSATTGYDYRNGSGTYLITIKKRKRDNLVFTDDPSDNTESWLEYRIDDTVGAMSVGDGLWVRLSDVQIGSGVMLLSRDPVVVDTDDYQNVDDITNRFEVLPLDESPLNNFDNKDVHLIARCILLSDGLTEALQFVDGTIIDGYGLVVDHYRHFAQDVRAKADIYLGTKTAKSVLFIDQTATPVVGDPTAGNGRIDEDNTSFNYDKSAQELVLFNNVFGVNYHEITTATDQEWFRGLGAHTLKVGDSTSNVQILGDLTVEGNQNIIGTVNVITSDKAITLGVGNLLYGGGGSGIQVADNTLRAGTVQTYNGQIYVDITPASDPGYVTGQLVGLTSSADFDDITASELSNVYTMKATGAVAGDAQSMGAGVYRVWTNGTATASNIYTYAPVTTSPVQVFDILSEIHLSSSGADAGYMTSWSFGVKRNPNHVDANNEGTVHAVLTPYESAVSAQDFMTIPTACQANFVRRRIPFAYADGTGPATIAPGQNSDTTFDFTERLYWDNSSYIFRVYGTLQLKGNVNPEDDNTYDIGTTALRWKTIHTGPGSVYVHNDNTDTAWVNLSYTAAIAQVDTKASDLVLRAASTNQLKLFTDKRGAFGIAYDNAGDSNALFEFGNDATNVLATATQYGTKVNHRLAGNTESHLMHIAGVAAYSGSMTDMTSIHIAGVTVASGSLSSQYGIMIDDLSAGSTKYGIYGKQTKASGKWFVYGYGDADSYFAGNVGIGNNAQATIDNYRLVIGTTGDTTNAGGILLGGDVTLFRSAADTLKTEDALIVSLTSQLTQQALIGNGSSQTNSFLTLSGTIPNTGTDVVGVNSLFTAGTTHVNQIISFLATPRTADFGGATTVTSLIGLKTATPIVGTNANVTNIYGIYLDDITSTATNRIGIKSGMTKTTGRWDLYLSGGASSHFTGSVGIGNSTQATVESFRLVVGVGTDTTSAGGMSFGGDTYLFRSAADTITTSGDFVVGKTAYVGYSVDFAAYTGVSLPAVPASSHVKTFAKDGNMYQMTPDGQIILLTNYTGNIYHEIVDVVGSPSGNNQMATKAAGSPLTVTLPQDLYYLLGTNLYATTTVGTRIISVKKVNHGLVNGNTIAVTMTQSLDGILSTQMTGSFSVTVSDADNFYFTASAGNNASVGGVSGYLDRVTTQRARYYIVGQGELKMYLNGVLQRKGVDWSESGTTNALSNQVTISSTRDLELLDHVEWVIDGNGGQTAISTFSASTKRVLMDGMLNNTGVSMAFAKPVRHTVSGLAAVDISSDAGCEGMVGLVFDTAIAHTAYGTIITSGRLEGGGAGFANGDIVYVKADGTLTTTRPSTSGHHVIVVGVVHLNATTSNLDLLVNIQMMKIP